MKHELFLCRQNRSVFSSLLTLGLALIVLLTMAVGARAQDKWALVVGVKDYDDPGIENLTNTVNDARTMAGSLNQMGFKVYYLENPKRKDFEDTVLSIVDEQGEAQLGFFYFAGHGIQVDGSNYALPSDIRPQSDDFLATQGISINRAIRDLTVAGTENLVVVLDSCRNSPFEDQVASGTGLALVDAPQNTIIAYSTAPGEIALDGAGANSPYTAALASALDGPQQDIRDVLRLVRARVRIATGGAQTPWFVDNSRNEIIIQPRSNAETEAITQAPEAGEITLAMSAWRTIANSADPRDFEQFVSLFSDTEFADAAKRQLELVSSDEEPSFPLMDLGVPDPNPEVPMGLRSIITECDILATGIEGGLSLVEPVPHDLVNTRAALRACFAAVHDDPENPRLLGLLSRVLYLEKRFPEALHFSELAAERGSAASYGAIGEIYRLGLGVPVDLDRASIAVRKGALAGSPAMRVVMGLYYREGWGVPQSFTEARRWMEIAALTGNVSALTALGDLYRRGQLGPKDPAKSIDFYRKAAALGHTDAMNNIGMAYMRGDGLTKDTTVGINWLSRASEQGNPYAAFHLGRAFLTGWGVDKNRSQALAYFRLSAQRNFLTAYTYIGDVLASSEDGNEPDYPEALANYIIAQQAGVLKNTGKSLEESAEAQERIDALKPKMSSQQVADGEKIAADWIAQFGLLDFNLVNE